MSNDNISGGPFWLLEQICLLIAQRNNIFFRRIIAVDGWFKGVYSRQGIKQALKVLKDFKKYNHCLNVSKMNVKLKFLTFRKDIGDIKKGWHFEEALNKYAASNDMALYGDRYFMTIDKPPDQCYHNETLYYLKLEEAISFLLWFSLLSFTDEYIQVILEIEVAPWRNTRPTRDKCYAIIYF